MQIENMIAENYASCCGCEACANICPKNAISMTRDAEGFAYPKINPELCIKCGKCDSVCPSLNFQEEFPENLPKVFVAINTDEKILRHSSSGGVFTALSEIILKDGGIIFGAGFDENFHVVHTSAENFDEMQNLRGSKYVQSQIGDVYRQVRNELGKGRKVLFTGTPCQCAGLKSFLGKDFENLLTVDVFCHGTPSPELWENYIDYRGQGHEIVDVNFRNKNFGWFNSVFQIVYRDCGRYQVPFTSDFFGQEFSLCLSQRPSCHKCKFRFPDIKSDISIGDAWGINNYAPDMFDNRGASLAVVHTDKGQNFMDGANLRVRQIDFDSWIVHNPYFFIPSAEDSRRKDFFTDLEKSKNPIITMRKYFLQNTGEVDKNNQEQVNLNLSKKIQKIVGHYSKKRGKNFLVFVQEWSEELEKTVRENFLSSAESAGIFVVDGIAEDESGKKFWKVYDTEFPRSHFVFGITENEVKDFKKNFGITNFTYDQRLNFDFSEIVTWLKD